MRIFSHPHPSQHFPPPSFFFFLLWTPMFIGKGVVEPNYNSNRTHPPLSFTHSQHCCTCNIFWRERERNKVEKREKERKRVEGREDEREKERYRNLERLHIFVSVWGPAFAFDCVLSVDSRSVVFRLLCRIRDNFFQSFFSKKFSEK